MEKFNYLVDTYSDTCVSYFSNLQSTVDLTPILAFLQGKENLGSVVAEKW